MIKRFFRSPSLLAALFLLFVGSLIFRDFLFGNQVLLYKDIGSDSLKSYYADFVHLSNYIRTNGFPSWSFHIGMGQDLAYATGFLIWEPVTWLPPRFIAQALAFQHLVKVLIAGLLFFRFLELRRVAMGAALLGSLLLAFSAYMSMGSCWCLTAEELLAFTAVLLGAEQALQRGRWLFLALSVALTGMINPFYLYLCALFLGCYVPARIVARNGWQPGLISKKCLCLAVVGLLGIGLGAFVTLPYLDVVLNSPRGAGATNSFATLGSFPLFGFESASHYVTALLRPLANDLLGTGDAFRGWQNYFEAPLTYCGLISLVLLPQAFVRGTRRHRVILLLFLLWLVVPTMFPWFRYLFWLFKGDYYRTYSLFSILGIITISMIALTRYVEQGILSVWLLVIWVVSLIAILYLPIDLLQNVIDPRLRIAVTAYLTGYGLVLLVGQLANKREIAAFLVIGLAVVELVHFNRITVLDRKLVGKPELIGGIATNRDTAEAMQELHRDDSSFYRTTVLRLMGGGTETELNEAMLLGYYGTSSYSSFNDSNYLRFLGAMEALPSNLEIDTRWVVGLAGNFIPSIFGGEKYALVEDPEPLQKVSQYELVRRYGDSYLFRNQLSLPLGLTFSGYLPQDQFLQLSLDAKEQYLLATVILEPDQQAKVPRLKRLTVAELEGQLAASSYPAISEQRRASAFQIASFAENKIEGNVRLDQDSILVLQTPFNRGWHASQDGQPAPVLRADIGLLGVALNAGEHKVALHYRNPWLIPGTVVSLCSLLLLAVGLWRWPRMATARTS
jgi:uncharacterized membrane protein YfhO